MNSPEPAEITYRLASDADAALLAKLARDTWTPHYVPIIGAEQVSYMLDKFQSENAIRRDLQNGYTYELALADGIACGYCATRADSDAYFLSKLYVLESCRGRGIARTLVTHAEERARQYGASLLCLTCNKRNSGSLTAYAHMGFASTGECVTPIGAGFVMDDYLLEKRLNT